MAPPPITTLRPPATLITGRTGLHPSIRANSLYRHGGPAHYSSARARALDAYVEAQKAQATQHSPPMPHLHGSVQQARRRLMEMLGAEFMLSLPPLAKQLQQIWETGFPNIRSTESMDVIYQPVNQRGLDMFEAVIRRVMEEQNLTRDQVTVVVAGHGGLLHEIMPWLKLGVRVVPVETSKDAVETLETGVLSRMVELDHQEFKTDAEIEEMLLLLSILA